jgi:glycosyltransferase involved in cell wall biosynthesis
MANTKHDRHVCIIDPSFTLESPSMKHLVYSVPALIGKGWRITVMAERVEQGLPVEFFRLRPRSRIPWLRTWEFLSMMQVNLRKFRCQHPGAVIFGTAGLPSNADVSAVHFLLHVWLQEARKIPDMNLRERAALCISRLDQRRFTRHFASDETILWLPVSESIADELLKVVPRPKRVCVLPNSYDESRFNSDTRDRFRKQKRIELNFDTKDFVFVFLSQGHYRRKGFWVAVEALAQLRREKSDMAYHPHLLVVGGTSRTLARLQRELSRRVSAWSTWIRFTGMIDRPEESLAAADAFLFPSFFEAFCLAEIEAAAMSLPLLLTAHHGSEMILQNGRNGLIISGNQALLVEQLHEFLSGSSLLGPIDPITLLPRNFQPSVGRALTRQQYSDYLLVLLDKAREAKHEQVLGSYRSASRQ